MTAATKTRFSETMLALGVLEERLHRHVEEGSRIDDDALKTLRIGPPGATDEANDAFWGTVEAIVAAEPIGTLGERLARLRNAGELTILDRVTMARLSVLRARLQATVEALGKVEDDFAAVLHYCGHAEPEGRAT